MCWDARILVVCVVYIGESGRVGGLPLPEPSPCNRVVLVLGTGALFGVVFVSVAEACVAGTGSGRSCGTNCSELHPPSWVCQST